MDRCEVEEVAFRTTKESFPLKSGQAGGHRPKENGDGTAAVRDLHCLARGHPSENRACLAAQFTDPYTLHVRHGSTSLRARLREA